MENQNQRRETNSRNLNLEEVFSEAEERLHDTISNLTHWTNQFSSAVRTKPGLLMASVSIAGFVSGLMLRQRRFTLDQAKSNISADPIILFLTGAFAGFTVGPRIMEDFGSESSEEERGQRKERARVVSFEGGPRGGGSSGPTVP